jgi:hypothetical protein
MVATMSRFNFNRTRAGDDGVHIGWGGGDHKYDAAISCEKNLRGEFLHWAFRVTKFAPPADEVKAQFMIELKGLMDAAGVQQPTAKMKREARESAQAVIEEKGKDGRWDKHTLVPVVWDGATGQVWFGTASHTHVGRFMALFAQTFGVELAPITAGSLNPESGNTEAAFGYPVWCGEDDENWLGNEFALWCLWRQATVDTVEEANEVPVVVGRLTMACPDGLYGTDTFACEVPVTLPEFGTAIKEGRLPRSFGLQLTADTTLTLDPELWVASGAKVPELDGVDYGKGSAAPKDRNEDVPPGPQKDVQRLEQCREVFKSLDAVYDQFLAVRLGDGWAEVVDQINNWTGRVPAGSL